MVITLYFPFFNLCIVDIIFLVESKGNSFTLGSIPFISFLLIPKLSAALTIETSVGSPTACNLFSSISIFAVVHIDASFNIFSDFSLFISIFNVFSKSEISTTFILFCVNVPVLSEHITPLLPSVSTAGNFLIMAFFLAIFVTPIDNIIVTIAGKPSGIAATASPTDVINISNGDIFLNNPITNIKTHITKQAIPKVFPTPANFFCIGVSGALSSIIIFAICPTFVFIPISVTTPSALPEVTMHEENAILTISPKLHSFFKTKFASLVAGTFSPVKLASSIFKLKLFISLQSAGTKLPDSKIIISPGTSSIASISCIFPLLLTFAVGAVIFCKASIDFSAFASCITPIKLLNITIAIIIIESK